MNDSNEWADAIKRAEERGRAYTQILLLIGYGGFFALWTQTADKMSLWMFASTGLGIIISMITFIGHEVATTYVQSTITLRCRAAAKDGPIDGADWLRKTREAEAALDRHYKWVFWVTAISGFGSGLALLFWFLWTTVQAAWKLAS